MRLKLLEDCGIMIKKGDLGTEDNIFGFEGGHALKVKDQYHLFTAEMWGEPMWVNMRYGHWKSDDGFKWEREGTIFKSSGDFEGKDLKAALFSPMPTYNYKEDRWNLFYVAYRCKPNTEDAWYGNYDGRIFRAASIVPGVDGIGGPYEDIEVILEPGVDSDPWEGLQGTDSFFPYQAGDTWYAFYGSANTEVVPTQFWGVGLAQAPELSGPWKRLSEYNPVKIHESFVENPVVFRLDNGEYLTLFDGGPEETFGYSTSKDGIYWTKGQYLHFKGDNHPWIKSVRTPLSFIPEGDNVYRIYFTAYDENLFGTIGMIRVSLT